MAKKLTLFALRLLSVNAIACIISFFIMTPLLSVWSYLPYQWFITLVFSFLMWLFAWLDALNVSKKDVKNDKIMKKNQGEREQQEPLQYRPWLGFVAGFLSQLPAFIVALVACFAAENLRTALNVVLRVWNVTYMQVYVSFEGALPYLFLIFPIIMTLVAGLAYLNGPVQQQRQETIIARNLAKGATRVQDEKKRSKKAGQKRPAPHR